MADVTSAPPARRDTPALENPIAALLTPEGTLTAEGERVAGVSDATLRDLYRLMVITRRLDQEGLNLQRQGELGLWGPTLGHEAAQVGGALAMRETDWIFPYYRDFGMAIVRGIDPGQILTVFKGLRHGAWDPHQYRFGPFVIPVGTQVPHAVGFAMGCKLDHEQTAVLTCFGEGATSTGDWHEAMNFAGVFKAPVVFLCQNNQWAISVPMSEQVAGRIVDRAAGYGLPGVRVDGADALAIYAVTRMAADHARRGDGPYLIEAFSYRLGPHTTSDDPTRYRTEADVMPWRAHDPIARAADQLRKRGAWDDAFERACQSEADERAARMRQTLIAATPDHPSTVFDLVYANPPQTLIAERDAFVAELAPETPQEGR